MTKKYWRTQKFRSLQKKWEKKLKDSGFVDMEDAKARLRQNAGNSYRTRSHTLINAKREYYEMLGFWQHETGFKDDVERLVMELKADGIMIKDICLVLKGAGERCHRQTVRWIIQRYEAKWKIPRR